MEKSFITTGKSDFAKPKGAGADCIVTAYNKKNLQGTALQVTNVPRCKTQSIIYDGTTTKSVQSFKLNDSCQIVKLWDQDGCRENYGDNVQITKSINKLTWDLNEDVCGITVTGKC